MAITVYVPGEAVIRLNVPSALAVTEAAGELSALYKLTVTGLLASTCPVRIDAGTCVSVGETTAVGDSTGVEVSVAAGVGDSTGVKVNVGVGDSMGVEVCETVGVAVDDNVNHRNVPTI